MKLVVLFFGVCFAYVLISRARRAASPSETRSEPRTITVDELERDD